LAQNSSLHHNVFVPPQYIRMSTEHQQYSPENQRDAIGRYADLLDIDVIQRYSDLGRSGLAGEGRAGLRALLEDVDKKRNDFSVLLVYDVSRWDGFKTLTKVRTTSSF
jgi:DNA invertase Pin-like site-specific DNA recombinase